MSARKLHLLAAAAFVLVLGGGIAYATIPDGAGLIHGCYTAVGGVLRVIDPANGKGINGRCLPAERALSWSRSGPQGPTGAQGPIGEAGPQGPAGTTIADFTPHHEAPVSVPIDSTPHDYPLTGATWTQGADQIAEFFARPFTLTPPSLPGCFLSIDITVRGDAGVFARSFTAGSVTGATLPAEGTQHVLMPSSTPFYAPRYGAPTPHTMAASVSVTPLFGCGDTSSTTLSVDDIAIDVATIS
jgi:hypothetical protein